MNLKPVNLFWSSNIAHSPFTRYEIKKSNNGKYKVDYWNRNEVTPTGIKDVQPSQPATGFKTIEEAKTWAQGHFVGKIRGWMVQQSEAEHLKECIQALVKACYTRSKNNGWWHDIETGEPLKRNKGEQMMLIVSEVAEAMEGNRKGLKDDHLPQYDMEDVEFSDALIRIFDYAGGHDLQLADAFVDKLEYNDNRADHKIENRRKAGGKKY